MPVNYDGYMNAGFVEDLDRARDFHRNVMGLEFAHDHDSFELGPDAFLLTDRATADEPLSPADVDHDPARGARSVVVTEVADVDAAYEELRCKGVEFIRAPQDRHRGMRSAHFKDPDGNVWEIHEKLGAR
jgi:lactoylglutathione lyase